MTRILRKALRRLPINRVSTLIYDLSLFWVAHRRLPRRPKTLFNDFLFTLKRSGEFRDIERQITSDKWMVKMWSREVLGQDISVPTIALLETPTEINEFTAPCDVVLKPTHLSGSVVALRKGERLSQSDARMLHETLSRSLWQEAREQNYRYLRPRIIAEEMLSDKLSTRDYKFFCMNGEPRLIQVNQDRFTDHKKTLYDTNWSDLPIAYNCSAREIEPRPKLLDKSLDVARKLSSHFTFVRVDLYLVDGRIFLGEITHCPENAHGRFASRPEELLFTKELFQ